MNQQMHAHYSGNQNKLSKIVKFLFESDKNQFCWSSQPDLVRLDLPKDQPVGLIQGTQIE